MKVTNLVHAWRREPGSERSKITPVLHLRPPAFDHGVISFLWALFFFVLIWIGGMALGFGGATTFIVGLVAGFGIFLYVRVYGEDEPPRSA
jgi:hypothetical protein